MSRPTTITEAAAALRTGEVTSAGLVERAIEIADATEGLGSFLARFDDHARAAAASADEALAAGADVGPLHGIPLGVKDVITTSEAPSTAQSLVLDPAWSDGDAVAVSRLRAAGGIVMGKTTTMEFAVGMPDPGKPFPIPRNPWNPECWAGGSSSGNGSAVATGAVLGALGTDTQGSIRIPAAYCGVTGLVPTFGRVPKSGCVPLGYSMDHLGPMARTARDCALLLHALAGHDRSDPSAIDAAVPDFPAALTGSLDGVRIGVDRLDRFTGAAEDPSLASTWTSALRELQALGAELVDVELPYYAELTIAGTVIMTSEALTYHLGDMRARWPDYFRNTRALIGSAALYSATDYIQAQRVRRVGQKALAETFGVVDLIATPTCSAGAPPFSRFDEMAEGAAAGGYGSINTPYWAVTGNPVLSVPMGVTSDGMPLGLQIAGRPFDEATVLRAGDAYQTRTAWHRRIPGVGGHAVAPA